MSLKWMMTYFAGDNSRGVIKFSLSKGLSNVKDY